jgi:thioredoxin 1
MNPDQHKLPLAQIGAANFDSAVLRSDRPVLVAFWAPWSRPCHILDSTLEEVAIACADSVKVVKVNADDYPDLSLWYEVQAIPTLLYVVDGDVRARIVGTASKEAIIAKLQAADHQEATKFQTPPGNRDHEHRDS